MSRVVTFTVAGRPSRWMRPAQGKHPKTGATIRFTDKKAEAEKRVIALASRVAWKGPPVCGPVALHIEAVFAIPKSWPEDLKAEALAGRVPHIQDPDIDQLIKQVQDALTGIVYWDDNQVCAYDPRPVKRYGYPERTIITITTYDQSEAQKTPGQRDLERAAATGQMIPGKARPKARRNPSKSEIKR